MTVAYATSNVITVDAANNAYITGFTASTAWPTVSPWQPSKAGDKDAFLAQVNTAGTGLPSLVYSTYMGSTKEDRGLAIARDTTGLIYLTGFTRSITFPVTLAPQPSFGGGTCAAISCTDTFITAFNLSSNAPAYSTFLGGANDDQGNAIATDSSGAAYIAGTTYSANFPTASPRQGTFSGGTLDAFVAKLTQPTWNLGAATASVAENASVLNLTVTLSAASPVTVTVDYATTNGTATAGSDYTAQSGTLTFAPGVTTQPISIPIVGDLNDEPNETFTLALTNPYGGRLGTIASTLVTITDDDAPPTVAWQGASFSVGEPAGTALLPVNLSVASAFTVTVAYATSNGSATAGVPPTGDYTASSGTLTFRPV